MGVMGKLVGGTIGFALGGPLGAIAGAAFGHAFDSSVALDHRPATALSALEESQLAFFVAVFSMLAKLARVDGRVTQAEIDTVESFAVYELGLTAQSREVAFNIFRTALESPASFEDFARQFYQRFANQPQMIEMMIDILLRVSLADGAMDNAEQAIVESARRIFGLEPDRFRQIQARYMDSGDQHYEVLGCKRQDSDEQIKQAYRKLVQTYHPDKISSKGLPEEFIHLAEDKFRQIQQAYEAVKKERGIR